MEEQLLWIGHLESPSGVKGKEDGWLESFPVCKMLIVSCEHRLDVSHDIRYLAIGLHLRLHVGD